ncbi:MAG: methylenetetrahydrofolate reductase [Candidatus Methylomirabilales bacterium]
MTPSRSAPTEFLLAWRRSFDYDEPHLNATEGHMKVTDKYHQGVRPLVTVDVNPPRGAAIDRLLSRMKGLPVDWLNITDNSGASVKADSIVTSYLLKEKTGIDVIPHIACRDSNRLGLQSRLLGAWMLGLDNLLALTGDRVRLEDKAQGVKGVFDVTSIELITLARSLNQGTGYNGRVLDSSTGFCIGATADPTVDNLQAEARQTKRKLDAGAEFLMTQPIFTAAAAWALWRHVEALYEAERRTVPDLPIFWGIILPKDAEWAMRVKSGQIPIPGIEIPDAVLARLKKGDSKESIRIAREVLQDFKEHGIRCVYIIPIGRYEIVSEILEGF